MNAKDELSRMIKEIDIPVQCAIIAVEAQGTWYDNNTYEDMKEKIISLPIRHTEEDYIKFFEDLDFEYDSGYGSQVLSGTVWFKDNTWLEREEYDGSEWWTYKKVPPIPKNLLV